MKRDQFVSFCFIALLIFVVYQVFLIFSPFFKAIFWSAILAFTFYPAYLRLRSRTKLRETSASIIMTAVIFLVVFPPVIVMIVSLAGQAIELYQSASDYVRSGEIGKLIDHVRSFALIQSVEERVVHWEPLKQNINDWLLNTAKSIGNFAAAQAGTITKNILIVFLNIILMTFLIFVFLKDGERIFDFVYQITPLEEKNKHAIFKKIRETFSAVIRGQVLTGITQAIISGLFFWLLGLPVPILFAIATFLAAMIPVFGASSVWGPLVIYLIVQQDYTRAIILTIVGVAGISLIDNLMKPALIGEKTKLPYFLLCFGILGGLQVYGLIGIFLAPVLLSLFFALIKIYQERNW